MLKMYIMVLDTVPNELVPVIAAHASLICYWEYADLPEMIQWRDASFRKVVCKVNLTEFKKLQELEGNTVLTESSLQGSKVAVVLCPRLEWPNVVRFAKMWKPTLE